jgi:hypothetical protein
MVFVCGAVQLRELQPRQLHLQQWRQQLRLLLF